MLCANVCGEGVLFLRLFSKDAPRTETRRTEYRRPVDEAAQLIVPSENLTLPCRVTNISDKGAGVVCDVVPRADVKIRLAMCDGETYECVIAWAERGHLGLRFVCPSG